MSASSSFFRFILSFRASASRRATWIFCWIDSWFMSAMLHSSYRCKEGVVSRRARERKRRCRRIQGGSQGAQQPGHRETSGGSRWGEAAMATGARVAAAIACAKRSMGRRSEGVVVERTSGAGGSEVCRRLARPRDTNWGQRKLP